MSKVLIAGGSGLIGRRLTEMLRQAGYEVNWLSRHASKSGDIQKFSWNVNQKTLDPDSLNGVDVIVNLAGASIDGKRWSSDYKKEIYDSRINSNLTIFKALRDGNHKLSHFISSSAIGYYGFENRHEILVETSSPGTDYLAKTCVDWESSAQQVSELGLPVSIVRTGVVFSKNSQAYEKIVKPIKMGLGAVLGNGNQAFPWISLDDISKVYLSLIQNKIESGIYNGVAPQMVNNKELMHILASHFRKKIWLPNVPPFALKLLFGEMANTLLGGSPISSAKLLESRFNFEYPTIEKILK